jgi:hypothetical protein
VTLRGQRKYGWWNYHQMVFVRGLDSENAVPAIFNEKDSWGTVTLVDSRIVGKDAGPKTPGILKIGTIIETVNGGITDAAGIFIYSNQGWDEDVPAFIIDNSTATLAGINERNFNRRPVSLWFRETQGDETRESKSSGVYVSR